MEPTEAMACVVPGLGLVAVRFIHVISFLYYYFYYIVIWCTLAYF